MSLHPKQRRSSHLIPGKLGAKLGKLKRKQTNRWDTETAELQRLSEDSSRSHNWKRWGPYLSERQWGTVREDYSQDGSAWDSFPHEHARSRVYRWGEDGLMGITDRQCRMCFGLGLWNGNDPILKERLFGLTGSEGNHGEDVKELYYYLDSTPTHSYMKALYKYPQAEYPYAKLVEESRKRGREDREYEIEDSGVFADGKYWDVQIEYAKAGPNDILIEVNIANRGPEEAVLHVIPQVWWRNTWSWGEESEGLISEEPSIKLSDNADLIVLDAEEESLGPMTFASEVDMATLEQPPQVLFTDNETNMKKVFGADGGRKYTKDAFHRFIIDEEKEAVNPENKGTKAGIHFVAKVAAGGHHSFRMRLFQNESDNQSECAQDTLGAKGRFSESFSEVLALRREQADEFYHARLPPGLTSKQVQLQRQGYAGLLWSKQFYYYVVKDWLAGDPTQPMPPDSRKSGRNSDWGHLFNRDVISMPDKWEYPWYALWDLAFHMVPFCVIDPEFAKHQLTLFLREWYMHPNGQLPAYEWALDDVNPPVHAWAVYSVYKKTAPRGQRDRTFLASCFHKLLLNFNWWVNRKDPRGNHLFSGGFLGLDNIGVFDRSKPLPTGGFLEQADGTSWMGFNAVVMLEIALELAANDPSYEDIASKFFEHFVQISAAINSFGGKGLWDEEDGFYYDALRSEGSSQPMKVRSMVGLIPLFATLVIDAEVLDKLPGFKARTLWFLQHQEELAKQVSVFQDCVGKDEDEGETDNHRLLLLTIPSKERLRRMLAYLFDEEEFFGPYGIRSLSKVHDKHPFVFKVDDEEHRVDYQPGESTTSLFGGNSNWRGPIWFPVNFLLIESLERLHVAYGDEFQIEVPTGSGNKMSLKAASVEIARRLQKLFIPDDDGKRPCHGDFKEYQDDPNFKDLILFYEYFDPDTGRGLGASHQTGWTGLITRCVDKIVQFDKPVSEAAKRAAAKARGEPE